MQEHGEYEVHHRPGSGTVAVLEHEEVIVRGLLGTLSEVFPYPEVLIGQAASKLDGAGTLTDPPTRQVLSEMLAAYDAWLGRRAG